MTDGRGSMALRKFCAWMLPGAILPAFLSNQFSNVSPRSEPVMAIHDKKNTRLGKGRKTDARNKFLVVSIESFLCLRQRACFLAILSKWLIQCLQTQTAVSQDTFIASGMA